MRLPHVHCCDVPGALEDEGRTYQTGEFLITAMLPSPSHAPQQIAAGNNAPLTDRRRASKGLLLAQASLLLQRPPNRRFTA